jgi:hypothetical protein
VIPVVGLLICIALPYGASAEQLRIGAYFVIGGAALYAFARWSRVK